MKLEQVLLQALLALGECYETDLRLMARTWGSESNAKLVMRKLLSGDDITVRETKTSASETVRSGNAAT